MNSPQMQCPGFSNAQVSGLELKLSETIRLERNRKLFKASFEKYFLSTRTKLARRNTTPPSESLTSLLKLLALPTMRSPLKLIVKRYV